MRFDPTKDTRLEIGLIRVQPGEEYSEEGFECDGHFVAPDKVANMPVFEIGNASNPVHADKKAIIRLHYQEGMKKIHALRLFVAEAAGKPMAQYSTDHGSSWRKMQLLMIKP